MSVGGSGGCRVRARDQERLPGRARRRRTSEAAATASSAAAAELRLPRKGKGPAGAALGSAVAAPAVWRRTGASGAPPAGARGYPGRASSRGAWGRARCAPGICGPCAAAAAAASELVLRGLAGRAARARTASLRPPRLLPLAVGASAAAGYTRRTGARAEPSPSRAATAAAAASPGRPPRARAGIGGWVRRAGAARAGEGARTGVGAEDRTPSREGSPAPQLRSTWQKENEQALSCRPPRCTSVHLFQHLSSW
ncbi:uncharacterized protein LOC144370487 [Ictidomys tridecemlineatus]